MTHDGAPEPADQTVSAGVSPASATVMLPWEGPKGGPPLPRPTFFGLSSEKGALATDDEGGGFLSGAEPPVNKADYRELRKVLTLGPWTRHPCAGGGAVVAPFFSGYSSSSAAGLILGQMRSIAVHLCISLLRPSPL